MLVGEATEEGKKEAGEEEEEEGVVEEEEMGRESEERLPEVAEFVPDLRAYEESNMLFLAEEYLR